MEKSSQDSSVIQNKATHLSHDVESNSLSTEGEKSRLETTSIKSSKSNAYVSTSSDQVNISNGTTTPLRISKQLQGDEYMIELELNKGGNNIRCYTYEEEVPKLP